MNIIYTRSSTIYDDSRATKEITAFLNAGNNVTVFAWDRNGEAHKECKRLFEKYNNKVKFHFYAGTTGSSTIQKLIERKKWSSWLIKNLTIEKQIDVIHACDFDTGVTVRKFALKKGIKYVYDIFDYYVDAHRIPKVLAYFIEKEEIKTINDAELTIICTEERKEQIEKSNPNRIAVIHNSPNVDVVESCEEDFDYAYCGSLYSGRLINEILSEYPKHSNMKFIFAGYGEYTDTLKQLDSDYESFRFLGSVTYSKVLELEKRSKVISAIYDPTIRNHQLCAPNKFYEALALGKPVIVCKGTGIDQIVTEQKIGIVIDYNSRDFYQALMELIENPVLREQMGKRARVLYETRYRWSIMEKHLLSEYDSILKES